MKKLILLLLILIPATVFAKKLTVDKLVNDKWECIKQDSACFELDVDEIRVYTSYDMTRYHIYSITGHQKTGAGEISTFDCGDCIIRFVANTSGNHILYIEYPNMRISIF